MRCCRARRWSRSLAARTLPESWLARSSRIPHGTLWVCSARWSGSSRPHGRGLRHCKGCNPLSLEFLIKLSRSCVSGWRQAGQRCSSRRRWRIQAKMTGKCHSNCQPPPRASSMAAPSPRRQSGQYRPNLETAQLTAALAPTRPVSVGSLLRGGYVLAYLLKVRPSASGSVRRAVKANSRIIPSGMDRRYAWAKVRRCDARPTSSATRVGEHSSRYAVRSKNPGNDSPSSGVRLRGSCRVAMLLVSPSCPDNGCADASTCLPIPVRSGSMCGRPGGFTPRTSRSSPQRSRPHRPPDGATTW